MMATLAHIWRHPIKAHGREALDYVALAVGQTMPWDRAWAVAHARATVDAAHQVWGECINFSRGSKVPGIMAIDARVAEETGRVTLCHPNRPDLEFDPDLAADLPRFLDWVAPLMPAEQPASAQIIRVPGRGMTDTSFPSISIANLASNVALSDVMGVALSPQRWRCNLWLDGPAAWDEASWIGQRLRVGKVELLVREPIVRCKATTANPQTGAYDADTLGALRATVGEQNFGVYAEVVQGGIIHLNDPVEVIA